MIKPFDIMLTSLFLTISIPCLDLNIMNNGYNAGAKIINFFTFESIISYFRLKE